MRPWVVMLAALGAIALAPLAPARAADQATAKPAVTRPAKMRHLTAEVKMVNVEAKTLTVTANGRKTRRELTFTVAPAAAGSLGDLKTGERVRIAYERAAGKLTAQSIAPVGHAASK